MYSIFRSSAQALPRAIATRSPRSTIVHFSSTPSSKSRGPKHVPASDPSHASVDENIEQSYPEKSDPTDLGHGMTNGGVGRHHHRTLKTFTLEGKVCVVTGAARGLGNLFARTLVESGCSKLAILDLSEGEAEKAAKAIEKWFVDHGGAAPGEIEAHGYGVDVSDERSVRTAISHIDKRWGRIDCLIAAAGMVENYSALAYPADRIRKLFDVNVHGAFFCAREVARHMIERKIKGGSIVLVSSMSANIVNVPQAQTPYNASKAAVKHMAGSLAVEWAKDGIRVNCLSPGYMLTPLTKKLLDEDVKLKNTWVGLTPLGRMGEPEDLKGAIIYLASDASSFTTGSEVRVDGGYTQS